MWTHYILDGMRAGRPEQVEVAMTTLSCSSVEHVHDHYSTDLYSTTLPSSIQLQIIVIELVLHKTSRTNDGKLSASYTVTIYLVVLQFITWLYINLYGAWSRARTLPWRSDVRYLEYRASQWTQALSTRRRFIRSVRSCFGSQAIIYIYSWMGCTAVVEYNMNSDSIVIDF